MTARLLSILLVSSFVLSSSTKRNVATAKGENEKIILTVTLYLDPPDVKELIGNDLGGHYIVCDVKLEPKYGKDILIDRDDFLLRTWKDGDKAKPFAPSQVAGAGAMVVGTVSDHTGVGSPGWTGATGAIILGGGGTKGGGRMGKGDTETSKDKPAAADKPSETNPLKAKLEARVLPEGKTKEPVGGLLYFPMEKQKMKDLELTYGGKEDPIVLHFKP